MIEFRQDAPFLPHHVEIMTLISTRLAHIAAKRIDIQDDSAAHVGHAGNPGGAMHVTLHVYSDELAAQSRIAAHRQILDALQDLIPHQVHACAIRIHPQANAAS